MSCLGEKMARHKLFDKHRIFEEQKPLEGNLLLQSLTEIVNAGIDDNGKIPSCFNIKIYLDTKMDSAIDGNHFEIDNMKVYDFVIIEPDDKRTLTAVTRVEKIEKKFIKRAGFSWKGDRSRYYREFTLELKHIGSLDNKIGPSEFTYIRYPLIQDSDCFLLNEVNKNVLIKIILENGEKLSGRLGENSKTNQQNSGA